MSQEGRQAALARAHARAREGGRARAALRDHQCNVHPAPTRVVPPARLGHRAVPAEGAAIIASNHKSVMDAFFVGVATRRHVRYVAKTEIFRYPRRLARFARNFTFCSRCCSGSWRR